MAALISVYLDKRVSKKQMIFTLLKLESHLTGKEDITDWIQKKSMNFLEGLQG
ncbi:MAG: hypothetical protein MZV64_20810 [Ignavibacteriales bacterium]|nr:hypothetical protein [Ignavibacteriales bacterium]